MTRGQLKFGDVFRYANDGDGAGAARFVGMLDARCPIQNALPTRNAGVPEDHTAEVVLLWRIPELAESEPASTGPRPTPGPTARPYPPGSR